MKILTTLSLVAGALVGVNAGAQLDVRTPVRVVIDGDVIQFPDHQPVEVRGRVFVPLRGVFERLGAEVDWDGANQTVTAYKRGVRTVLAIGQHHAIVNDRSIALDAPPRLIDGRTMVPLRFVSEALGANVTWNEAMLEADISQATSGAILETRTGEATTEVYGKDGSTRSVARAIGRVIESEAVIPWSLNDRLSTNSANQGDPFTATLVTDGQTDYLGIPAGSVLSGTVGYIRTHQGDQPGVIELRFDRIVTPNGHMIPVQGRLIALDDKSVVKGANGAFIARGQVRNDRTVYAGVGVGGGLVVGLISDRPIEDAAIGGLLGLAMSTTQSQNPSDVVLTAGTTFGVRLSNRLVIPETAW